MPNRAAPGGIGRDSTSPRSQAGIAVCGRHGHLHTANADRLDQHPLANMVFSADEDAAVLVGGGFPQWVNDGGTARPTTREYPFQQ